MATSVQLERDDSFLEAHRTSLLEVVEDKNRTLNKVNKNKCDRKNETYG